MKLRSTSERLTELTARGSRYHLAEAVKRMSPVYQRLRYEPCGDRYSDGLPSQVDLRAEEDVILAHLT
jgi:hypothetical protein